MAIYTITFQPLPADLADRIARCAAEPVPDVRAYAQSRGWTERVDGFESVFFDDRGEVFRWSMMDEATNRHTGGAVAESLIRALRQFRRE